MTKIDLVFAAASAKRSPFCPSRNREFSSQNKSDAQNRSREIFGLLKLLVFFRHKHYSPFTRIHLTLFTFLNVHKSISQHSSFLTHRLNRTISITRKFLKDNLHFSIKNYIEFVKKYLTFVFLLIIFCYL